MTNYFIEVYCTGTPQLLTEDRLPECCRQEVNGRGEGFECPTCGRFWGGLNITMTDDE